MEGSLSLGQRTILENPQIVSALGALFSGGNRRSGSSTVLQRLHSHVVYGRGCVPPSSSYSFSFFWLLLLIHLSSSSSLLLPLPSSGEKMISIQSPTVLKLLASVPERRSSRSNTGLGMNRETPTSFYEYEKSEERESARSRESGYNEDRPGPVLIQGSSCDPCSPTSSPLSQALGLFFFLHYEMEGRGQRRDG
ncbi:hypothetical protein EYF80_030629 [Liparis tanakae]|uniref:Uncharacterized protein n=1 Tax=Liparis tanakae TaxID=230148 RepID=A0A4Z2H095_9TELE|nr:hypothetical protein EYF80_030629 [Liparis tanakae]